MGIGVVTTTYHAQDIKWPGAPLTGTKSVKFSSTAKNKKEERRSSNEEDSPPYRGDVLGANPEKQPGEGFEWRGKGNPSSGRGSWVRGNGKSLESLHPDLAHPEHGAHWDYLGPNFPQGARIYPDGTWELK